MITDVSARKTRLEALLERVRTNRARLGHPGAAHAARPSEDEEPRTDAFGAATAVAEPPAPTEVEPLRVWEGEDEDIEMEVVGTAASEEELLGVPEPAPAAPPPPPPPLPSTTVSPTSAEPAAAPVEAVPSSIRIESPPLLEASPIRVVGALAPAPSPTIGMLLRRSIDPSRTA